MIDAKKIIVALDFSNEEKVFEFLPKITDLSVGVKIGMELFYSTHKDILKKIKDMGFYIFLDLKLHDIPHTVDKAMTALSSLPFDIINVHALGGKIMMENAVRAIKRENSEKLVIAVTHLTSSSEDMFERELQMKGNISDHSLLLSKLAYESGCDGVVASALDAKAIKTKCGDNFKIISPGIRISTNNQDDQVRIATPMEALKLGSDFLVIGRPITGSLNPRETLKKILNGDHI